MICGVNERRSLWCVATLCEDREADGVTVSRRYAALGEQELSNKYYYALDHLGSVRESTNSSGSLVGRYAFDPWGVRVVTAGADYSRLGFTGHAIDGESGLALALYRVYDPQLGRWLSNDPMSQVDGPNLYSYVNNSPVAQADDLGLMAVANRIVERVVDQSSIPKHAVALTNVTPVYTCTCRCEGGSWRMEGLLLLYGEMFLPKTVTRQPAVDGTVRDTASARAHEYTWHINPAIEAARRTAAKAESKFYASESECLAACNKMRRSASNTFRMTIRQTQADENSRR